MLAGSKESGKSLNGGLCSGSGAALEGNAVTLEGISGSDPSRYRNFVESTIG